MSKVLVCDSREQKNAEVIRYMEIIEQPFIVRKVESGDYIWNIDGKDDYSTIIDLKKDLVEVAGNIAGSAKEHQRFKKELARARDLGCKRFVVLIREPLPDLESVQTWQSPRLRNGRKLVNRNPITLYKTMRTFQIRYGVEWVFTTRFRAGEDIIKILNENK